jgi:hypothetical protein
MGMSVPKCTQMNNIQLDYRYCKCMHVRYGCMAVNAAADDDDEDTKSNYARNMCCTVHTHVHGVRKVHTHTHRTLARQIGYTTDAHNL